MGNRVDIEKRKRLRDDFFEFQVSDQYEESPWFLMDFIPDEKPEALAWRCCAETDEADGILEAAMQNGTYISTPLGDTDGRAMTAYLVVLEAQEEAMALDETTPVANRKSSSPRL